MFISGLMAAIHARQRVSELDIEAEPVLVTNTLPGDGFDSRLPSPGLFDHVLVRARIDGQTYWLDGTLPDVVGARTLPFFGHTWVLPLSARGTILERAAEAPFDLPQEMELYDIDASAGFDEPARWTHTTVLRGAAALEQHVLFTSVSAAQLEAAVRGNLTGSGQWDSVESVKYRFDRANHAGILTLSGVAPVKWEKRAAMSIVCRAVVSIRQNGAKAAQTQKGTCRSISLSATRAMSPA